MMRNRSRKAAAIILLLCLTSIMVLAGCDDSDDKGSKSNAPTIESIKVAKVNNPDNNVYANEGGLIIYTITVVGSNAFPIDMTSNKVKLLRGNTDQPPFGVTISPGEKVTASGKPTEFQLLVSEEVGKTSMNLYITIHDKKSDNFTLNILDKDDPVLPGAPGTVAYQLAELRALNTIPPTFSITATLATESLAPQTLNMGTAANPLEITLTGSSGAVLNLSSNGAMFTINQYTTLIIENIELRGRNNNARAVIDVNGGTLTMKAGAKITGNTNTTTATNLGGGVRVYGATGIFTMEGGEISGNRAASGGGVSINAANAVFTMNGGKISGNTATAAAGTGGGVQAAAGAQFTMNDSAEISGNTSTSNGGGVSLATSGTNPTPIIFTMNGGTISNNSTTADYTNGGGVFITGLKCFFIMRGGTISGNTAVQGGGGVANWTNSDFLMYGGTITGNTAAFGGGAMNFGGGRITMSGGVISNNTATLQGGGIDNQGGSQSANAVVVIDTGIIYGADAPEGLRNKSPFSAASANSSSIGNFLISGILDEDHGLISQGGYFDDRDFTIDVQNGQYVKIVVQDLPYTDEEYVGKIFSWHEGKRYDMEPSTYWYVEDGEITFHVPVTPGTKSWDFELEIHPTVLGPIVQTYLISGLTLTRGDNTVQYDNLTVSTRPRVSSIKIINLPETRENVDAILWAQTGPNEEEDWEMAGYDEGPFIDSMTIYPTALFMEPKTWNIEIYFVNASTWNTNPPIAAYEATVNLINGDNEIDWEEFANWYGNFPAPGSETTVTTLTVTNIPGKHLNQLVDLFFYDDYDDDFYWLVEDKKVTSSEVTFDLSVYEIPPIRLVLYLGFGYTTSGYQTIYVADANLVAGANTLSLTNDFVDYSLLGRASPRMTLSGSGQSIKRLYNNNWLTKPNALKSRTLPNSVQPSGKRFLTPPEKSQLQQQSFELRPGEKIRSRQQQQIMIFR